MKTINYKIKMLAVLAFVSCAIFACNIQTENNNMQNNENGKIDKASELKKYCDEMSKSKIPKESYLYGDALEYGCTLLKSIDKLSNFINDNQDKMGRLLNIRNKFSNTKTDHCVNIVRLYKKLDVGEFLCYYIEALYTTNNNDYEAVRTILKHCTNLISSIKKMEYSDESINFSLLIFGIFDTLMDNTIFFIDKKVLEKKGVIANWIPFCIKEAEFEDYLFNSMLFYSTLQSLPLYKAILHPKSESSTFILELQNNESRESTQEKVRKLACYFNRINEKLESEKVNFNTEKGRITLKEIADASCKSNRKHKKKIKINSDKDNESFILSNSIERTNDKESEIEFSIESNTSYTEEIGETEKYNIYESMIKNKKEEAKKLFKKTKNQELPAINTEAKLEENEDNVLQETYHIKLPKNLKPRNLSRELKNLGYSLDNRKSGSRVKAINTETKKKFTYHVGHGRKTSLSVTKARGLSQSIDKTSCLKK